MLRLWVKKVEEQSDSEDKMFDAFACYCSRETGRMEASLAESRLKVPELQSAIQQSEATIRDLQEQLHQHKSDEESASTAANQATEIRSQEKQAFERDSSELKSQISALKTAVESLQEAPALQQGVGLLAWLQNLATASSEVRVRHVNRHVLSSLLQEPGQAIAHKDQITGMLQQMLQDMSGDLDSLVNMEKQRTSAYDQMQTTKKQEMSHLMDAINTKQSRVTSESFLLIQLKQDLTTTRETMETDSRVDEGLRQECDRRQQEYKRSRASLQRVLDKLSDMIQIMSAGLVRALFKATLPVPPAESAPPSTPASDSSEDGNPSTGDLQPSLSFLQVPAAQPGWTRDSSPQQPLRASQQDARGAVQQSMQLLRGAHVAPSRRASLRQLVKRSTSAAHGPANGLGKISKLVDQMLTILSKEQEDDDSKKQRCATNLERERLHVSKLQEEVAAAQAELNSTRTDAEAALRDQEAMQRAVRELDQSVQEATENRKAANSASARKLAEISDAISSLKGAQSMLSGVALKLAELAGGTGLPTMSAIQEAARADLQELMAANASLAGMSAEQLVDTADSAVHALEQGGVKGKHRQAAALLLSQVSFDAIEMLKDIVASLKEDFKKTRLLEEDDQKEYEILMQMSASKRSKDVEAITHKSQAHAELQATAHEVHTRILNWGLELKQTQVVIANLHMDCDKLLQGYEAQKKARGIESRALRRTQATLLSADAGAHQG